MTHPTPGAMPTMPDKRRLHYDLTDIVIRNLHYFDNLPTINGLVSAAEVTKAIEGGIDRYRTDTIFRAKVQSCVAQLLPLVDSIRQFALAQQERADTWQKALMSLTAGGSEFTSPQSCIDYVRAVRESQHSAIVSFKERADRARELALEEAAKVCEAPEPECCGKTYRGACCGQPDPRPKNYDECAAAIRALGGKHE